MPIKKIKDLTIEDLERLRDLVHLDEHFADEVESQIALIYWITSHRPDLSEEEIRTMTFEEVFELGKQ
jgi:hypothetical protein